METLDLRGKTCPVPVIETKQFVEGKDVREIMVRVDNLNAFENVRRFLDSKGFSTSTEKKGEEYYIKGIRTTKEIMTEKEQKKKILVLINGDTIGRGNDELGRVLMKAFLFTLKDLEEKPWRIIFINAGVSLTTEGSECLDSLFELERLGVEILSCGTCLDFFHLKDRLKAGRVSNMYEIVSSFIDATNIIKP